MLMNVNADILRLLLCTELLPHCPCPGNNPQSCSRPVALTVLASVACDRHCDKQISNSVRRTTHFSLFFSPSALSFLSSILIHICICIQLHSLINRKPFLNTRLITCASQPSYSLQLWPSAFLPKQVARQLRLLLSQKP
jgi:hypothetical protein